MTRREQRVINAFINCVKHGEFTEDYAITLIEDNQRYGWLSEEAKEYFYEALHALYVNKTDSDADSNENTVADDEEPVEDG